MPRKDKGVIKFQSAFILLLQLLQLPGGATFSTGSMICTQLNLFKSVPERAFRCISPSPEVENRYPLWRWESSRGVGGGCVCVLRKFCLMWRKMFRLSRKTIGSWRIWHCLLGALWESSGTWLKIGEKMSVLLSHVLRISCLFVQWIYWTISSFSQYIYLLLFVYSIE